MSRCFIFSVFLQSLPFGVFRCFWLVHLKIWSLVLVAQCSSMYRALLFSGQIYGRKVFFHIAFQEICSKYSSQIDCCGIL